MRTHGTLTPREAEVLALVARGLTSSQIGERLGIATATVDKHMEHVRLTFGVRTRAGAVHRAFGFFGEGLA